MLFAIGTSGHHPDDRRLVATASFQLFVDLRVTDGDRPPLAVADPECAGGADCQRCSTALIERSDAAPKIEDRHFAMRALGAAKGEFGAFLVRN